MRPGTVRSALSGWVDPATVFAAVYSESDTFFWLDAGADAVTGMSYLGSGTTTASSVEPGVLRLLPSGELHQMAVLEFLRARMPGTGGEAVDFAVGNDIGHDVGNGADGDIGGGVGGGVGLGCPLGWVGWLGYEVGEQTLSLPGASNSAIGVGTRHPDAAFIYCDRLVAFDHDARTVTLIALGGRWSLELCLWRDSVRDRVAEALASKGSRPATAHSNNYPEGFPSTPAPSVQWRDTDGAYLEHIARCQSAIVEGEAYQLCLTTAASVVGEFDPVAVYAALRAASPTHHGGFLRIGGVSLLSSSPERFLAVGTNGVIESKPIKGTRRRGHDPVDDQRLRNELLASEKERAENLMIVDLMRNDIGRVSEVGSVRVPVLMAVESYAQVHQLVSTVRGRLAVGRHPVDAVIA